MTGIFLCSTFIHLRSNLNKFKSMEKHENSSISALLVGAATIPMGIIKWGCIYHNLMINQGLFAFIIAFISLFSINLVLCGIILKCCYDPREENYFSIVRHYSFILTIVLLFIWFQFYDTFCCTNPKFVV